MNKNEKIQLLKAALSGNRLELENILKANETPVFVEMQPGLYCTNQHPCECISPKDCIYLKDETGLKKIYSKASFIGISDVNPGIIERFADFDEPAPEKPNPITLRNLMLNLEKYVNQ